MTKMIINFSDEIHSREKALARKVVKSTLQFLNQPENVEVCISVVSDEEIRKLNAENRKINKVTDVLSFPALEIAPGENIQNAASLVLEGRIYLGDVVISRDQIERQAKEYGATYDEEFARMVLHSILHLLGYDHIKKEDEKVMKAVEVPLYEKISKIKLI